MEERGRWKKKDTQEGIGKDLEIYSPFWFGAGGKIDARFSSKKEDQLVVFWLP